MSDEHSPEEIDEIDEVEEAEDYAITERDKRVHLEGVIAALKAELRAEANGLRPASHWLKRLKALLG